jgi:hypothetical protein
MSALDAVHEQQQFFLVAQRAQAQQIVRGRRRDSALTLNALDQNGHGGRRNRVARGFQIIVRNVTEARHDRLKSLFDLVLAGGGNPRQGAAMKRVGRGENLEPSLIMSEFAGELVEPSFASAPLLQKKTLPGPIRFTSAAASRPCGSVK